MQKSISPSTEHASMVRQQRCRHFFGYLQSEYYTVLLDFQTFDASKFKDGNIFSIAFAGSFLHALKRNRLSENTALEKACADLKNAAVISNSIFSLKELFECLRDICAASDKLIVLMIDEVDSASNNQVFLDFFGTAQGAIYRTCLAACVSICYPCRSI